LTDAWFTEVLYTDFQQRLQVSRVLYQGASEFQEIMVFENPRFGRVLALDGVVQTTERDEFAYHEMMAHVPILAHGAARRVAIIGGGDGGTLEEVLKHAAVERAMMIEIDDRVVQVCRELLPDISAGAFDDPRAELIIGDGVRFMKETTETFDVIIVDSTDPMGPSLPLFGEAFYADCKARLSEAGIIVTQSGVTFMQEDEARHTYARMRALYADAALFLTQVPTYGAGFMTLGWGANSVEPRRTPYPVLEQRFAAAELATRYYSPAVHQACFALPGYIDALKRDGGGPG
jgi:spermidine synthase